MYLCVNGIFCLFLRFFYWNLEMFRQCGIFWGKCSDIVVFFGGNVPTVWYFFEEMFRQCGIFWGKCSDIVVFFGGNVPTVWYFLEEMFRHCGIFWRKCSDSVVFSGGNVPKLWYFLEEMFRQCGIFSGKCSDSVVFFAFHFSICTEQDKIDCLYLCTLPSNYYLIFTFFLLRSEIFFCCATRNFFFQISTLRYMTKTLNQIILFSSTTIRIFFSSTFGMNILEKKHNPPPSS
jgi:hypothetical protein